VVNQIVNTTLEGFYRLPEVFTLEDMLIASGYSTDEFIGLYLDSPLLKMNGETAQASDYKFDIVVSKYYINGFLDDVYNYGNHNVEPDNNLQMF
jgi:hypothetical protein